MYLKSREEIPTVDESHQDGISFNPDDVEVDKTITGYKNLTEFLDNHQETYVTYSERFDKEIEGEVSMYRWCEVDVENAPVHEFCHCGAEMQTRSAERLENVSMCHHVGTGH